MTPNHFIIVYRPPRPTFAEDATEKESAIIGEHFEFLKRLLADKVLLIAGRTDDASMGIAVFQAPDRPAAEKIMRADPAVKAGVFSAELHRYRLALFAGK
ncbi:MAG: YciI family protein [Candidatus Zixiibacteriota bacterium]